MTRPTPEERGAQLLALWEQKGWQPMHEQGWMNPEDKAVFIDSIADAIHAERAACVAIVLTYAELIEAYRHQESAYAAVILRNAARRIQEATP